MSTQQNSSQSAVCTPAEERQILLVQYIFGGWITSFLVLFGVFGNMFSIFVLSNRRMRYLSTNIYLLALSITNLAWLSLYFFVSSLRFTLIIPSFLQSSDEQPSHIYDDVIQRTFPYAIPLMNTLQLCSIYYTVAVSFDRLLYLSYGVQADSICNVKNSLRTIATITIFAIVFILPHWFKHRVVVTEKKVVQLKLTRIGENETFRRMIHVWFYIPVVYAIPFVLLILINVLTMKLLHKFYLNRRRTLNLISASSTQNDEQHQRDITLMLIGVVVLFFVCRFPMLINHIFETKVSLTSNSWNHDKDRQLRGSMFYESCRTRRFFNVAVNFLQAINASANLFFFYLFGEKFRETSFQLINLMRKRVVRRQTVLVENVSSLINRRQTNSNSIQLNQQQITSLLKTNDEISPTEKRKFFL